MLRAKQASKAERRIKAVPVLGAAGLSTLASGVQGFSGTPAADLLSRSAGVTHEITLREASADAADAQIRPPDPAARLRLPDQNPHSHQARLQKPEIRHRDVGAEQRRRRLLGEPGLQLVQRSLEPDESHTLLA